jgi:hypothetical protein
VRNWGLSESSKLSSPRIVATGESNQSAGSHGDRYASPNVIRFPAPTSLPDQLELRSRAPLFIPDDTCAVCALAVVVSCFVVALSAMLYAGYSLFFLFDLG